MRYYEIMMYEVRRCEPTGVMSPAAADVSFLNDTVRTRSHGLAHI